MPEFEHHHPGQQEPRAHGETHHEDRIVDLNTASEKEISDLPMVGADRAKALLNARPFRSWDDVSQIPGFGPGMIDDLKSGALRSAHRRGMEENVAEMTTNHDDIRQWAERHGGKPAAVDRTHTGDDVGIIRIMFPNAPHSEHGQLVEISWEEFFAEFEDRKLALLHDPDGLFSKIIGRDTAEKRAHGDHNASRHSEESRSGGEGRQTSESDGAYPLKQREYHDSDGTIHHHTHAYMEQHRGEGSESG